MPVLKVKKDGIWLNVAGGGGSADADTLDGKHADEFVQISDDVVYSDDDNSIDASAPINADTLGGHPASEYATQNFVTNKIAEAQLGGGEIDIDLSGYATKEDLANIDYPVDSVNGKTGTVSLSASDVGAAPASHVEDKINPHDVTAEQVGARPNTWLPSPDDIGAISAVSTALANTSVKEWAQSLKCSAWAYTDTTTLDMPVEVSSSLSYAIASAKVVAGGGWIELRLTYVLTGCVAVCVYNYGWGEWEWENPPMVQGVEYRTTEQMYDKAVYKRMSSSGFIEYLLDGETTWKRLSDLVGAASAASLPGSSVRNSDVEALGTKFINVGTNSSVKFRIASNCILFGRHATTAYPPMLYAFGSYSIYRSPGVSQIATTSEVVVSTGGNDADGWYIEVTNNRSNAALILYFMGSCLPEFI